MKIKNIVGALSFSVAVTGCSLDVKMYDGVMSEDISSENIAELTYGSYRHMKGSGIINNGFAFREYGSDDVSWTGTSNGSTFKIYDYTRDIATSNTEYAWELGYRAIGNTNLVIELVDALGERASRENIILRGENYYLRALCYFYLVNEFAQPYSNNPQSNPGLPLKLDSNPDVMSLPKSRSTVAEVYDQIVKDLKDAIVDMTLPAGFTPKNNNFATKEAAEALLARVYLYMGDYGSAYTMADNVIKSGRFKLEQGERYAKYAQWLPEDNTETIFAIRHVKEKDSNVGGNMFIRIDGNGYEEISVSDPYLRLLELYLDENDMPIDLRSKYVVKRFVEDGVKDFAVYGHPDKKYERWTFVYSERETKAAGYKYTQLNILKKDGQFVIADDQAGNFQSEYIQSEPYNLGKRYYVLAKDGTKYIGRVEPKVFDAATKHGKMSQYLVYAYNKTSYQEEYKLLYSPVISRLAEMYLIRAEANAEKGEVQLALDDVNIIRRRAGIPEWTIENMQTAEAGEPKDIKKIVEEERRLEFALEGLRRFDVFRKRGTLDRRYPGSHATSAGDRFLEVPYNSPAVCQFIPQAQYDAYPYELEQNP
ncbi:RagB/SusD family nutrient uptake outer membrane protein [Bacteroides fluxus]|uniref:SusD family protein n=1 Tax=Bacteroides fluxus YIT 12057 TaxID=763034 RepID=F3PT75_9BACE|nr:RagB/SusD family nutrient uptake outer membrane protein [Bacteroides fluxus]EGF57093.1 SusD family protein [Bacteroides fluxus YIT 12057]MDY3789894.1 RagB/SusD family nutrient uptake outer membrane protein [Bacteroides fluxus]